MEISQVLQKKPIAYFCAEFALTDDLPTYAGGLGILAGDYIRELKDQNIPAIALSLLYRDTSSEKVFNPQSMGLEPVSDSNGQLLTIKIPILDKDIIVRAWKWENETVPVYLLDTDYPENNPEDRKITHKLYTENKEIRLKQEMILGIGGLRLLRALHISPSLFHMNEGHSSMLALELINYEMQKRKIGFQDAVKMSLHHLIFTNHTLVPAGHETFSHELFTLMLNRYASEIEVPVMEIFNLGAIQESNTFSMSLFAIRLAAKSNAVSILHGKNAEKIWPDYKIEAITNGIHLPTWDKCHSNNLFTAHQQNKKELLHYIHHQTGTTWTESSLLIGWARRMVHYKRPLALFGEIEYLKHLVQNYEKPVRIIISGSPHPADHEGIQIVNQLRKIIKQYFSDNVVYLPNYQKELARILIPGTDVWLNTPVVGSEACGTSGMKAALNGVLPITTKDGWVYEIDISQIGWEVDNSIIQEDIIRVLREEVIPEFFQDKHKWQDRMKNGRGLIIENYSMTRMLENYMEKMYLPIIEASEEHYFS